MERNTRQRSAIREAIAQATLVDNVIVLRRTAGVMQRAVEILHRTVGIR